MLKTLTVAEARAIAEASFRRSRDERAMVAYLGVGSRRRQGSGALRAPVLLKPTAVDLAAFESAERDELREALARLSVEARRELLALVWYARSPSMTFERALFRTRRVPPEAQVSYLMGLQLERYVAAGLERLGYRPGA